jgi:quercetin dioxygenase-like cupin family protein
MTEPAGESRLRERLLDRIARSAAAARAFTTVRSATVGTRELAPGVQARDLYRADAAQALRPGEPVQVRLIELKAGAVWAGVAHEQTMQRQCLVLRGELQLGAQHLVVRDFVALAAGEPTPAMRSDAGALVYWRLAPMPKQASVAGTTSAADSAMQVVVDANSAWDDYAPGIERRVLWQRGPLAAMLYRAAAGAQVPRHGHGHDEECLMVEGEVFLDDVLMLPGDWQLAPAGSGHEGVSTEAGGVLFAHGDVNLAIAA